ncbi:hypothetical protein C8Q74DRAFT_1367404 [Fomes fomentarius]|nr:hypothetical protein C8Q74DRAFT_1367404 [Fomes fomentarius]
MPSQGAVAPASYEPYRFSSSFTPGQTSKGGSRELRPRPQVHLATTARYPARQDTKFGQDAIEGGLLPHEYVWRDACEWLGQQGYKLRPRYQPDWIPSWRGSEELNPYFCEDGRASQRADTLDAVRMSDGRIVMLKRVCKSARPHADKSAHLHEEDLLQFFSQQPRASDSRNHAVPLYDVLQWPRDKNVIILVMPYLVPIQKVRFMTIREAVECFRQLLEGLQYMHHHNVAYRSDMMRSIMVNPTPLFSDIPHPIHTMRSYDFLWIAKQYPLTTRPSRFYYADFGRAYRVPTAATRRRENAIHCRWDLGCDPWPPEVTNLNGYDPFRADMHSIGRFLNAMFLQKSNSFEFIRPLLNDMLQDDPGKRPKTIDALVAQFRGICEFQLQTNILSARIVPLRDRLVPIQLVQLLTNDKYKDLAEKLGLRAGRMPSHSLVLEPSCV